MLINVGAVFMCLFGYLLSKFFFARLILRLSLLKDVSDARTMYVTRTINIGLFGVFFSLAVLAVGIGYGQVSLFLSSIFAVVGVALFANWSILSNLTGSLIIFFAFPYRVGSHVKVVDKDDDISGVIEAIEPFHVLIRRANGDLITYPNNLILQRPVIRLDAASPPPARRRRSRKAVEPGNDQYQGEGSGDST